MKVTIEKEGRLGRRVKVRVPAERLASEVEARLQKLSRTARVQGFRKGKAPPHIMRLHYGDSVRRKATEELVRETLQQALEQAELRPVHTPQVELDAGGTEELRYTAVFDILPEIKLRPLQTLTLENPQCAINEEDIDRSVTALRRHRQRLEPLARPAQAGDIVEFDYRLQAPDGSEAKQNQAQWRTQRVELGQDGGLPANLNEGLLGLRAEETRLLHLRQPGAAADAQALPCQVRVRGVFRGVLPEIDEDFCRALGVTEGGLPALRREVRRNLELEKQHRLRGLLWRNACRALVEAHEFDVPESLVRRETERGLALGIAPKDAEQQARLQVREQLIVGEIVRQQGLRPAPERVRALLEQAAAGHRDPHSVIEWHYADPRRLRQFESMALEEAIVALLLDQARVREVQVDYALLTNPGGSG
ncbi:MAG: trigger factor [Gammaproteobacteria bacterium]|nr:trigger factor [Gammaproteobacteria bacterium]